MHVAASSRRSNSAGQSSASSPRSSSEPNNKNQKFSPSQSTQQSQPPAHLIVRQSTSTSTLGGSPTKHSSSSSSPTPLTVLVNQRREEEEEDKSSAPPAPPSKEAQNKAHRSASVGATAQPLTAQVSQTSPVSSSSVASVQSSTTSAAASAPAPHNTNRPSSPRAVGSATSSSSSQGGSSSATRNRRVFNFTTSAFEVLRFKRLALSNPKLLRKYGVTSVQIRDTCNGEALQSFALEKSYPESPPPSAPAKHKPPPKATQFTPIPPQNLVRGSSATSLGGTSRTPTANSGGGVGVRGSKLATTAGSAQPSKNSSSSSLIMEQRAVPHTPISRLPSQQQIPPQMQQAGIGIAHGRMDSVMTPQQQQQQESGSSIASDSPLLTNLLSTNNHQQMDGNGSGIQQQQIASQQMNPAMMRYTPQQMQQQNSPMYPGAQQAPLHYMHSQGASMAGRIPPSNMPHPMMMGQHMGANMAMPTSGQIPPQQQVPGGGQSSMPPPAAQGKEATATKKRKRQTKKQKEEEEAKKQQQLQQQQQQQNQATPTAPIHSNIMQQSGMTPQQQQMHPDYYMMSQGGGQQRVPPVNMHMAQPQMQQQYRAMPYAQYMQHPQHYAQASTSMMGTPPQYPGQQHYQQQMWNPNMQQHHIQQQSDYQQMQIQRGAQIPSQQGVPPHYPAPQQSPAPDMKNRTEPPSYNDSIQQQQQFAQQQRTPTFMSPPPSQTNHPTPNYSMPGQPQPPPPQQQQQQQQVGMQQSQAQHHAQQLQHQRAIFDISENVDDIMQSIGGESGEDFDLDSIELEPMRTEGSDMHHAHTPQSNPPPQQHSIAPNAQQQHYYQQAAQQSMPPNYPGSYGSPSAQQYQMQQNQPYQMQQNQLYQQQQMAQERQREQQREREQQKQQQKNLDRARDQQQKIEQKELEKAMNMAPEAEHPPGGPEITPVQKIQIDSTIDRVMEWVMSGRSLEDSGASTSTSQSTPPPAKRKKQSTAKNAAAAAVTVQLTMPAQPHGQQFVGQMPPMGAMYGNGPGTPTGGPYQQQQQQQQIYYQRMQHQLHMRHMSYPQGGPSTPLSAPPVSTPDSGGGPHHPQQYYYAQQQQAMQPTPNGAPHTPSRANSFKMPPRDVSNPHTPQTPAANPQQSQQIAQQQKMFENGGSSATSSAAATPSSISQHRMSIDEQQAFSSMGRDEMQGYAGQAPNFNPQQQQQYAQYNGHATPNFMYTGGSTDNGGAGEVNSAELKMQQQPNTTTAASGNVVALKSHLGAGGDSNNASSNELCTPPSANAGISSATPTTASQLNHVVDTEAQPIKHEPPNEAVHQPAAATIKHELNHSHEQQHIKEEIPQQEFGADIIPKSEHLNGPTTTTSTTSTVAE